MSTLMPILAQAADEPVTLTPAGAAMMIFCVTLVLGLNVFCLFRILRSSNNTQHDHALLDDD